MSELEKQITGDWYEVRSALDEPDTLVDFLNIAPSEFTRAAEQLRFAMEEGVVEYKRGLLHSIMYPLKSLKWDSKAITDLNPPLREAALGVLTPAVQRLFALGLLRLYSTKTPEKDAANTAHADSADSATKAPLEAGTSAPAQSSGSGHAERTGSTEQRTGQRGQTGNKGSAPKGPHTSPSSEQGGENPPDIKSVVQEVKNMLKDKPELRNHQEVKKIMLQLKYYNTELEKMRSLAPNIPPEKAEGFKHNFQTTFNEIAQKIAASYTTLMNEEMERNRPKEQLPILKRYDFDTMDKLFRDQIANGTRIFSTIRHAEHEKYQMREILVELSAGEPYYGGFFDRELKSYKQIAPFGDDYLKISRAFGTQVLRYYERYAEWIAR